MDSRNQEKTKTTSLRSKLRPGQYPPFDAVSASAITAPVTVVAVGNTISDYAPTAVYSPLEMEIAEALLMLALVSESDKKSEPKPKKMHECNLCGKKYTSGQALGGHKRLHHVGPIKKRKRVAEGDPVECQAEKKPKS